MSMTKDVGLFAFVLLWTLESSVAAQRQGPIFIQEPPQHVDFANSSGAVIPCSVHGRPAPSVSWVTRDGSPVMEVPGLRHVRHDGSLVLPPFRADQLRQDVHNNVYRCLATNSVGTIVSRDVRVRGVLNQQYSIEVYDEFVIRGNTAVLRCLVPSFVHDYVTVATWTQDATLVIDSDTVPGSRYVTFPTGELHVLKVDHADNQKVFQCKTRNQLTGEVVLSTSGGRLFVTEPYNNVPPRITDHRRQVKGHKGDTLKLPCAAQGFAPPTYRWHRRDAGGQMVGFQAGARHQQLGGTLLIRDADIRDNGVYVCVVNNTAGTDISETEVLVAAPLSVIVQPSHKVLDAGRSVIINCTISGYPVVSVDWRKDGLPLNPNPRIQLFSRDTLRVTSARREDKGMYQCFAANEWDSAQGATQLDLGDDAPVLTETFLELSLHPGSSMSLKCKASGNPLPQVTWTLYGLPIPENPYIRMGDYVTGDSTVVSYVNVTSVKVEDGGLYSCTAANDVGAISYQEKITVFGPPFVRQMSNMSVIAGEPLLIHCPVGGHPIDSVDWEKEGQRIPFNHRQFTSNNGTLQVEDVQKSDKGWYMCIARNKEGQSAQNNVFISVLVRPFIEPFNFPPSLHEGQRFNLLCTVSRGDPPMEIAWFKDGQPFKDSYGVHNLAVSQFSSTLIFEPVTWEHRGNYTCVATNPAGSVSNSASMVIHVPPRWTHEPVDSSVVRGHLLMIHCQAEGFPLPKGRWTKAQGKQPSDYRPVSSSSNVHVYENGSLSIMNTREQDAGYYMCQASNGIGKGLSKVTKVTVHVAAYFRGKFHVEMVKKGRDAKLVCAALGDKPITIVWLKDKQHFDPKLDKRYEVTETVLAEGVTSQVVIHQADRRDSALFTCVASNAYGHDDTNIQLMTQEPPDAPQDVRVTDVASRNYRVIWTSPYTGNSPILQYTVQYKVETDRWHNRISNVTVPGTETTCLVTQVEPNSMYQIRVLAENALGSSGTSSVINIKTLEEAPGGPPLNVRAHSVGSQTILVSWKAPRQDLLYGTLRGFYVGYKIVASKDKYVYKTVDVQDNGIGQECHVTHLQRATKYSVVVQAFNNKGAGPPSEEVIVRTLDNDPPAAPVLKVVSSTPSTIYLSWNNRDDDTPVSGYLLHHKTDLSEWKDINISTPVRDYTIHSLRCGTRYHFYLTAFNKIGVSDPSEVISSKTDGVAPLAPDKQSLLSVNTTSVSLSLDMWHDGGCPITTFSIRYKSQRDQAWTIVPSDLTRTGNQVTVSDLTPDTWYQLQVTASNEAGSTEAEYSFFTQAVALAEISPPSTVMKNKGIPFYSDVNIIIPTVVSLAVVTVVVGLVCVIMRRRTSTGSSHSGSSHYDSRKVNLRDSLQLSELEKRNHKHHSYPGAHGGSLYYPAPYATTRLADEEQKTFEENNKQILDEPLYATVKRLPRPPRSDLHIYHYPSVHISADSMEESLASVSHWKEGSIVVKMEEPPSEKCCASMDYQRKSAHYSHR